jgi:trimeric autotransporter adhesin
MKISTTFMCLTYVSKTIKLIAELNCKFREYSAIYLFLIGILLSVNGQAQNVNVSGALVGNGSYATLQAAFAAINGGSQSAANIVIEIANNTTETGTAVLNQSSGPWATLSIQPSGGDARIITGNLALPLINLNGADNVMIDGLNSGGNSLTISNTSTGITSGTSTIQFIGDATQNTITRCTLLGSFNTTTITTNGGILFFSTGVTTGNDNNTVSFCNIGPATATFPTKAIFFNGTTTTQTHYNSGNVITNNNIFDFFHATAVSAGIYISTGNFENTISNNRFYQTATRTQTTGTTHACVQIAGATAQKTTVDANIFGFANAGGTGMYTFAGTTSSRFYPFYVSTGPSLELSNITNNTVTGISVAGAISGTTTSAPFTAFMIGSSAAGAWAFDNNTIGSLDGSTGISFTSTSTSTSDVYGSYHQQSSGVQSVTNHKIGTITLSNAFGGIAFFGIRTAGSAITVNCDNNIIGGTAANSIINVGLPTSTANRVVGITAPSAFGTINNNIIRNMTVASSSTSTTTSAAVIGISQNASSATGSYTISDNLIHDLKNTVTTSTASWVIGIYNTGSTTTTFTNLVYNNFIHSLTNASTSATANIRGFHIASGKMNYYNNRVIVGNTSSEAIEVYGIYDLGTTSVNNYYFNTLYVGGGSVIGASVATYAFRSDGSTNLRDIRNNIFYNSRSNGTGSGTHYAIRLGGVGMNPTGLTTNFNCLRADGDGGVLGFYDGANRTSMAAWRQFTGQDNSSTSSDPLLDIITLKINSGSTPTALESGGTNISGITTDFENDARPGPSGSNQGGPVGGNPDIGADEFDGVPAAPMVYVSSTTEQVTGVVFHNTSNQPVIQIQITTTGSSSAIAATSFTINANGTTSLADLGPNAKIYFTGLSSSFGTSVLFGQVALTTGNLVITGSQALAEGVNNFWLAYDIINGATTGNFIDGECTSLDVGGSTVNPTVTAPAGNRTIVGPMAGTFNVGANEVFPHFTTLKDAISDLNNRGVSAAVTLLLTNGSSTPYDVTNGEVFPMIINPVTGASGTNTITIKPAPGMSPVIRGAAAASTALIRLAGADFFIIDGSNSGTMTRDLTIENTSTNTNTAAIWVSSLGTALGATDNIIRNCIVSGGSNSVSSSFAIQVSGTSISTSATGNDNDNLTISNNDIRRAYVGIHARATTSGKNDNLVIINNTIGNAIDVFTVTTKGIDLVQADAANISNNTIFNIKTGVALNPKGIEISTGVTNSIINANRIFDIIYTGTGGYGPKGIDVSTASAACSLTFSNNVIYNLLGDSWSGLDNDAIVGIRFLGTNGVVNVYHNSVNLGTGAFNGSTSGTISGALYFASGSTNFDVRNNVLVTNLVNNNAATHKSYAIYSAAVNTAFTFIDYNDYFVSGSQGVLGFIGGDRTDLNAIQTGFGQNTNSLTSDPLFNNPTALTPLSGSPLLGAGTGVGIGTDFLGIVRSGATPSIGAYELGGDAVPPAISYTPLNNTLFTTNVTLSGVSISDALGIPTSGGTEPRIYYRKNNGGTWYSKPGTLSSGNGISGDWSFTIVVSDMGSLSQGDSVFYYVVAQDLAGNISALPSAGFSASSVNTIITPPSSPDFYRILPSISGTISVPGDYTTLTGDNGLFEAINNSVVTTNVIVNITANLTEPGIHSLLQFSENPASSNYTVTIRPSIDTERIISGNVTAGPMIQLAGADRVTFDGRYNASGRYLRFRNTGTSQPTFGFINDATNNVIRDCFIEGSNIASTSNATPPGVIYFGGTTGTTGNDDNQIINNQIRDRSDAPGVPLYGIFSAGTLVSPSHYNSGVLISNNEIFNIGAINANPAANPLSLFCAAGSHAWTISNNHFYQVDPIATAVAITPHNIIVSTASAGDGFIINGNVCGGSTMNAGGSPWTVTGLGSFNVGHYAIRVNTAANNANTISNNRVANISLSQTPTSSSFNIFGIFLEAGICNVTGNIIGDTTGTHSIILNTSGTIATQSELISFRSPQGGSIDNNIMGGMKVMGTATGTMTLTGLNISAVTTTNPLSVKNNKIGSILSADNMLIDPTNLTTISISNGILNACASPSVINIDSCEVSSITSNSTGSSSYIRGIAITSTCNHSVTNSLIANLTTASVYTTITTICPLQGIIKSSGSTAATSLIKNNRLHSFALTNTGAVATNGVGILVTSSALGRMEISHNRIWNFSNASTGVTATSPPSMTGIFIYSPSVPVLVANNQITLGEGQSNNTQFNGIWNNLTNSSGPINAYHNTVSISGTVTSGALPSHGFLRGNNTTGPITTPVKLYNNNFNNTRTGGTGKHYAIANQSTTASTVGWIPAGSPSTPASDFNNLYSSDPNTIGKWGSVDQTLISWISVAAGDVNSVSLGSVFTDVVSGVPDPVLTANCHLDNNGNPMTISGGFLADINTDFYGAGRSVSNPDIGANEFSVTASETVVLSGSSSTICSGQNYDLTFTMSGGTAPWSITYFNGISNVNVVANASPHVVVVSPSLSTTYSLVSVTDASTCALSTSGTATATVSTLAANPSKTNITCFGAGNGTATANASGGLAPFTYLWTPGNMTTSTITGLASGTYNVTVTDADNCVSTGQATITEPAILTASALGTNVTCNGAANGSISTTVGGGTAPYSGTWTNTNTITTFTVIDELKTVAHPYYNVGSSFGYTVNGVQGRELTLFRGITYSFNVNLPGHPIHISTDAVGGNFNNEITNGVTNSRAETGTMTFTPNNSHPALLWYQCGQHANMGWKINIMDPIVTTYNVIDVVKDASHPYFGVGSTDGFALNGVQGAELTLIRGVTYSFVANNSGHPFHITTSAVGGNTNNEVTSGVTNTPVEIGTLTFTPNAGHPNLLYYQCGVHANMGWKINIVDGVTESIQPILDPVHT